MSDFLKEISSTRRQWALPWVLRKEIKLLAESVEKGEGWRFNQFSNTIIVNENGVSVWLDFITRRVRDPETIPLTVREWWVLRKAVKKGMKWVPLEKKDAFAELVGKLGVNDGE